MVSRNRDCIQRVQCRVLIPLSPLGCKRAPLHVVIATSFLVCSAQCVSGPTWGPHKWEGRKEGKKGRGISLRTRVSFIRPMSSRRLCWGAYRRAEEGTWAHAEWSMPRVKVARRWEIRPTPAVRGIGRTRALMWQRARGLAQACRRGEGYQATGGCGDPNHDSEQLEMVCVEVTACATGTPGFS